jgi:hypothetical protein
MGGNDKGLGNQADGFLFVMQYAALLLRVHVGKSANKIRDGDLEVCYTRKTTRLSSLSLISTT